MLQLIYISKEAFPMKIMDIAKILTKSRHHNQEFSITGYLIYHNKRFMQVLEGSEKDVMALYRRIEKDPRHTNVTLIYRTPITRRAFEDWSMGYVDAEIIASLNKVSDNPSVVQYFQEEIWKNREIDDQMINKIIDIVKQFQQGPLQDYTI